MKKIKEIKILCCLVLTTVGIMFAFTQLKAADYYISFVNGGGNVTPVNISILPNTKNFEVDKVPMYIYARWYVDGVWKENDNSGILAIDPDYSNTFNTRTCGSIEVKCKIYNNSDYTSWNSTYRWNVTVGYNSTIFPSTSWKTSSHSHGTDLSWIYRIYATERYEYTFKTGCGDGATANYDTKLNLNSSSCSLLDNNDDGCSSNRSIIKYTPVSSGYIYLKVYGYNRTGGNFTLAFKYVIPCSPTVSVPSGSTVGAGSGSVNIPVTSNGCSPWSASESCSWVDLSSSGGTGNGNVTATYSSNSSCNSRSCTISFSSGSATDSYTLTQDSIPDGIEEIDFINNMTIHPNPNSGEFTLEMELTKPEDFKVKVLNLNGQVIYIEKIMGIFGKYQNTIDLSGYAKGIYILEVITKEGTVNNRVVVQ